MAIAMIFLFWEHFNFFASFSFLISEVCMDLVVLSCGRVASKWFEDVLWESLEVRNARY